MIYGVSSIRLLPTLLHDDAEAVKICQSGDLTKFYRFNTSFCNPTGNHMIAATVKRVIPAGVKRQVKEFFGLNGVHMQLQAISRMQELYYRDMMSVLDRIAHFVPHNEAFIETDCPGAVDTEDHKFPWGTMQDNTRLPRFVAACERYFASRGGKQRPLTYLDLGCS